MKAYGRFGLINTQAVLNFVWPQKFRMRQPENSFFYKLTSLSDGLDSLHVLTSLYSDLVRAYGDCKRNAKRFEVLLPTPHLVSFCGT